jgi:hypothetical protein
MNRFFFIERGADRCTRSSHVRLQTNAEAIGVYNVCCSCLSSASCVLSGFFPIDERPQRFRWRLAGRKQSHVEPHSIMGQATMYDGICIVEGRLFSDDRRLPLTCRTNEQEAINPTHLRRFDEIKLRSNREGCHCRHTRLKALGRQDNGVVGRKQRSCAQQFGV